WSVTGVEPCALRISRAEPGRYPCQSRGRGVQRSLGRGSGAYGGGGGRRSARRGGSPVEVGCASRTSGCSGGAAQSTGVGGHGARSEERRGGEGSDAR